MATKSIEKFAMQDTRDEQFQQIKLSIESAIIEMRGKKRKKPNK